VSPPDCPQPDQPQQFLLGIMSGDDSQQIESHFENCESCLQQAEKISSQDTLTNALADRETNSILANLKIQKSVEKISESTLTKMNEMSVTSQTVITPAPGDAATDASSSFLHFLSPAKSDDELGRLGGYRILSCIGQGGMGLVLLAEDLQLQRKVALKVIKPEVASQADAKDRFLREARTAASIEHDNIVTIFQVGEENGVVYLAMQLLEGEALQERVAREKTMSLRDTVRIAGQIASGLKAAHDQGLTHRDIKPDNIWLEAGNDRVKILDFGLARGADEANQITQSGVIVGTPQYLAPEQAEGREIDSRADLFSLGVVLYRMLTGKSPFARNTLIATLGAIGNHTPPPPHELRSDIPPALSSLVMGLLEKKPEERIDSAETFLARLKDFIASAKSGNSQPVIKVATDDSKVANRAKSKKKKQTASASAATIPKATLPPRRGGRAASKPNRAKTASAGGGGINKKWLMLGGGGLAGILLLATIISFSFKTTEGEWKLEVYDSDVKVVVTQDGEVVKDLQISAGVEEQIDLSVGQYDVKILNAGNEVTLEEGVVSVSRNGQVTAKLMPVKVAGESSPTQQARYALRFMEPEDRVDLGTDLELVNKYTIEGWLYPMSGRGGSLVRLAGKGESQQLSWLTAEPVLGAFRGNWENETFDGLVIRDIEIGQRTHFALSWNGNTYEYWINGKKGKEAGYSHDKGDFLKSTISSIGAVEDTKGCIDGLIETLRYSQGVRYKFNFTPPNRFEADENTIALYHMDEGRGGKLTDSSGNGHHGNIYGAEWIELDPETFEPREPTLRSTQEELPKHALRFMDEDTAVVQ